MGVIKQLIKKNPEEMLSDPQILNLVRHRALSDASCLAREAAHDLIFKNLVSIINFGKSNKEN